MDPALFETILREARQMGTYRVVLGGNGDPTLHPQFDRMLELMDRLEIVPYVLTNGIGIDEPRLRVWATKRAHFRFSMHAGDVETWLRVHTVGTEGQFQQLCRTIRALVAAGTPHISTMHVIHKQNYRHVRRMVEHARELGVKDVLFRPVRATGLLADVVLDPEQETWLRHELAQCLKLAERYHIRTNLREVLDHNLYIRSGVLDTRHLYRRIPCYIGWIYAEFDIEGAMTPCLDSRIVMGHAGRDRLRDMWTSPRYWTFRAARPPNAYPRPVRPRLRLPRLLHGQVQCEHLQSAATQVLQVRRSLTSPARKGFVPPFASPAAQRSAPTRKRSGIISSQCMHSGGRGRAESRI